MADIALIKQLLELLENSCATTIEIRRGFTTYRVSRDATGAVAPQHVVSVPVPVAPAPGVPAAGAGAAAAGTPPLEAVAPVSRLIEVKSPMVGTFYRAPEPGAEPYVKVASRVTVGQTLCLIEAMKIMNELEAEVSGAVREILVEDAQPVEFGQVLFRLEP